MTTDHGQPTLPGQATDERPQNGTDVLIVAAAAATGQAQGDSAGRERVETPVEAAAGAAEAEDRRQRTERAVVGASGDRPAGAFEVRCPNCHALQFLARGRWECVAIDEAIVAIKCWRRTCKRVLGLRPVAPQEGEPQRTQRAQRMTEEVAL